MSKHKLMIGITMLFAIYAVWMSNSIGNLGKVWKPAEDKAIVKKAEFIATILPAVEKINSRIIKQRRFITALYKKSRAMRWISPDEKNALQEVAWSYKLAEVFHLEDAFACGDNHWNILLHRADSVPASLTIAQAALESAWGRSRFAREGNNYFGIRCREKGCGIIPKNRGKGKIFEVKSYDSVEDGIKDYVYNLNTHKAYKGFRKMRAKQRITGNEDGKKLMSQLQAYSEMGQEYIDRVIKVIEHNKLERYDTMYYYAEK